VDAIKTEPDSGGEICLTSPSPEDVINAKLEDFPVAIIKSEASVSFVSLHFFRMVSWFL
jgi:hypothetical protein